MRGIAVILLASMAVANAAFTGSLTEEVRPLLAKAAFESRLSATRSSAGNQLLDAIQQHASTLLNQIEEALALGQHQAEIFVDQLQQVIQQLIAQGATLLEELPAILQNLLQNLIDSLSTGGGFREARRLAATFNLPAFIQQALQNAFGGLLTTDQINTLISQLSAISNVDPALIQALTQLMLDAAKPKTRLLSGLTTDQINTLISQLSVMPNVDPALIQALTQLLLDAAKPNTRVLSTLTTDQISTLISMLSVMPNVDPALIQALTQLLLDAAKPKMRMSALPAADIAHLSFGLQLEIVQARNHELTSDQISTLISKLSPIPGTGPVVIELTQLMLDVSGSKEEGTGIKSFSNFLDVVQGLLKLVGSSASNTYELAKTLVKDFIYSVVDVTGFAVSAVATQFLKLLRPFKWFLGGLYDKVVSIVQNIVSEAGDRRF